MLRLGYPAPDTDLQQVWVLGRCVDGGVFGRGFFLSEETGLKSLVSTEGLLHEDLEFRVIAETL
jgi:hypothetical protein